VCSNEEDFICCEGRPLFYWALCAWRIQSSWTESLRRRPHDSAVEEAEVGDSTVLAIMEILSASPCSRSHLAQVLPRTLW